MANGGANTRFVAPLARGGSGEVYVARDERAVQWAMKVVQLEDVARDRHAAERAMVAAGLLRSIAHVNVIGYHDAFVDTDGAVVLVTELLPGQTLRQALTSGPLPIARALNLAHQLAEGVAAVHKVKAVHRDIKPENVFVMVRDVVKLLDLGLAACAGLSFKTTRPLGTPLYMSPEQLRYSPSSGERARSALGCLCHGSCALRAPRRPPRLRSR